MAFNVNLCKVELEDPNKINVSEIQIVEPIPPRIRNFLISGKQIKSISENGDVKEMQLIFSQDLMKVSLKKIKSNLPPKPKYIIDSKNNLNTQIQLNDNIQDNADIIQINKIKIKKQWHKLIILSKQKYLTAPKLIWLLVIKQNHIKL